MGRWWENYWKLTMHYMQKGINVMYVELLKVLYRPFEGCQAVLGTAAMKKINNWKFVPSKYDSCVVNRWVAGKQLMVLWHVDDLKVSHSQARTHCGEFYPGYGERIWQGNSLHSVLRENT